MVRSESRAGGFLAEAQPDLVGRTDRLHVAAVPRSTSRRPQLAVSRLEELTELRVEGLGPLERLEHRPISIDRPLARSLAGEGRPSPIGAGLALLGRPGPATHGADERQRGRHGRTFDLWRSRATAPEGFGRYRRRIRSSDGSASSSSASATAIATGPIAPSTNPARRSADRRDTPGSRWIPLGSPSPPRRAHAGQRHRR